MPITFDTMEELIEFCETFQLSNSPAQRRGRPPKKGAKKRGRPAKNAAKNPVGRPKGSGKKSKKPTKKRVGPTLTSKIQDAISQFVSKGQSFTANDIYYVLAKNEKEINKQSVITSVLKQMNTNFADIKVTDAKGNGPRPVKLYQPA